VDAILMATAHILKTDGFERASTNRIAELAGVSIGSLYQYFPNKEGVVSALRERHGDWFRECLNAEVVRIRELPVRAAVRGVVEILVALHVTDPELHNALAGEGRAIHAEQEAGFRQLVRAYLVEHASELRPMDPEMVSFVALRAMEAVIHSTAIDDPERMRDPAFVGEVTELLARYLEL
jgi:AcrR family transcriptional regulator